MQTHQLICPGGALSLSAGPVIMGILNVTPDSFSDGGRFLDPQVAVAQGLRMVQQGAGIIDVGGESTRPGAAAVPPDEQIRRVVPVIQALARETNACISIDTTSSKVATAALAAGAGIINDISALRFDRDMAALAAEKGVPVVLMHMLGEPGTMQGSPTYLDVVREVRDFLAERMAFATAAGIAQEQIVIDPGIGFGKTVEHNLLLMKKLEQFHSLGCALLVGPSRKSFIGKVLGIDDPADRLFGTAAAVARCTAAGAQIIRVHDVAEMSQVIQVTRAMMDADHATCD